MTDHDNPLAPIPEQSPEEVAMELLDEYQESAIDYCADGVREAKAADDDVAVYHWLRFRERLLGGSSRSGKSSAAE